jgi:membrane protein XagC
VKRLLPVLIVGLITFVAVAVLSRSASTLGLIPDDAVTLWANAITAGDGEMPIGRVVAAYPTLLFLATTLLEFITPAGTPAPIMLTACGLALLAWIWLAGFRRAGLPVFAAVIASLLLALHPAMLRAAVAGPAEIMLAVFLFLLADGLYALRARSSAPEVMAVALALLGLAFSHPMGAALACAAIPLLVFAVRPEMLASSVFNLVIALVFPTVFFVGAFTYMSWVFPGSGWSFLVSPAEGLANWAVGFSQLFDRGLTGSLAIDAGIAVVVALLLAAPVVPVAIGWVWRRRPLVAPAMVIATMTVAATCIAVATGVFGDPAALAVMPPILAAIVIIRVPVVRQRLAFVLPLLAIGWIGGVIGLAIVDPRGAINVRAALEGGGVDRERTAAISLGNATVGRDGILVDTFNAPAIVLGRGRATGLLSPSNEAFTMGVLFSRIETPFVAVPDPQIGIGAQDRLNKAFPLLYRRGAPGYRMIYENANWRLFARECVASAKDQSCQQQTKSKSKGEQHANSDRR